MQTGRTLRSALALVVLCLPAGALHALDPRQPVSRYGMESWQTESGLPQNTVTALAQTSDGYLWLATDAGLVRFDGQSFQVFNRHGGSLPADRIVDIKAAPGGGLWIATASAITFEREGVFSTHTPPGAPRTAIYGLVVKPDFIGALSSQGLLRWQNGDFVTVNGTSSVNSTSSVTYSAESGLWIGTEAGLLHLARGASAAETLIAGRPVQAVAAQGQTVFAATRSELIAWRGGRVEPVSGAGPDITALLISADHRLWAAGARGLAVMEAAAFPQKGTARLQAIFTGAPVRYLYEDREHTLWAASAAGLLRVTGGQLEQLSAKDGVSNVMAVCEDREGDLWLGTETSGVIVLRDRAFHTFTARDGLSDEFVRSIFQDRSGTVWVGTNGGGLNRWNGGQFTRITTREGLSSNVVLAITDDARGGLWVGTPDGLNYLRNGKVRIFTSADGLADDFVRSLYTDHSGAVWIGTRRGLTRYQENRFTNWSALDGLGSDLVGVLLEDRRDGSLWIGTLGGLSHYANGRFTNFTVRSGLGSNIVTALEQQGDGTLWIATQPGEDDAPKAGGLTRLQGGRFTHLGDPAIPPKIYSILADASGALWLGASTGVYRRRQDGHVQSFGVADGMRTSECSTGGHPEAARLRDGSLWFATLRGVSTVNPAALPAPLPAPQLALEETTVDGRGFTPPMLRAIPPGHPAIAFRYAGLSFAAPEGVRYRYRLDGFDAGWTDAGARRDAFYTNLPPGRYTFRLMAMNKDGVWSEPAAMVELRLLPHFYQTLWFDLLLLVAAALLAYEAYRWRVRRVEGELRAVMGERSRIAREIHDTLAQGFVAVSVQLELVSALLESSREAARAQLDVTRTLVRSSLAEARRSIWQLRAESATQDFASRLRTALERATASTGLGLSFRVEGTNRPLARETEDELLRIAQEAATNTARHAHAGRIETVLRFDDRAVTLLVEDDGQGFAPAAVPDGHFGILGMHERVQRIGGEISIESAPGAGTRVRVHVAGDGVAQGGMRRQQDERTGERR